MLIEPLTTEVPEGFVTAARGYLFRVVAPARRYLQICGDPDRSERK
jgi:hypothetical protein